MIYRTLPHGGEKISVLGFGSGYIGASGEKEILKTVNEAVDAGINYFDLASSDAAVFPAYGKALSSLREKVMYQIHFGANYETGSYGWTTNLETIKRSVDWQLKSLKTDYIDFGFIHCIDEESDLFKVTKGGVIDYIKKLKDDGVIHHIGLSTHSPELAEKVLDLGIIDMMMFSINPAYDISRGDFAMGSADERMHLYHRCEKEGVGISVMKPFCGGQLLSEKTSPLKVTLSEYQCIQYALDKPAVLTVLPGMRNSNDLKKILGYLDANDAEKDYSIISVAKDGSTSGKCVYCNHCKPCPVGLDIGLINKYYDLSKSGDDMAKSHYEKLELKADSCISCGHCNKRCPFSVDQMSRMKEIAEYFK